MLCRLTAQTTGWCGRRAAAKERSSRGRRAWARAPARAGRGGGSSGRGSRRQWMMRHMHMASTAAAAPAAAASGRRRDACSPPRAHLDAAPALCQHSTLEELLVPAGAREGEGHKARPPQQPMSIQRQTQRGQRGEAAALLSSPARRRPRISSLPSQAATLPPLLRERLMLLVPPPAHVHTAVASTKTRKSGR